VDTNFAEFRNENYFRIARNFHVEQKVPEPHCGKALSQINLNDAPCCSRSATLLLSMA
jgi:hypothetical protein